MFFAQSTIFGEAFLYCPQSREHSLSNYEKYTKSLDKGESESIDCDCFLAKSKTPRDVVVVVLPTSECTLASGARPMLMFRDASNRGP